MDYDRTPKGITYRGIRRAFADEANSNSDFVSRIDKALGGGFIGVSHGAFMKNQGTDLHLQVHQPDGADGRVALIVHIDQFLDQGIIDLGAKPKVKNTVMVSFVGLRSRRKSGSTTREMQRTPKIV
jgi:hypothetical protein